LRRATAGVDLLKFALREESNIANHLYRLIGCEYPVFDHPIALAAIQRVLKGTTFRLAW